jgi:hypothetical protein
MEIDEETKDIFQLLQSIIQSLQYGKINNRSKRMEMVKKLQIIYDAFLIKIKELTMLMEKEMEEEW